MELIEYIRLFRRWAWLTILAAVVAGGVSFISRSGQPPVYQATTQIMIGSILQNPDPDSTDIRAPVDLTATYSQIVRTNDVLEATIDALDLSMSAKELRGMIDTRTVPDTSLLVVTITYTDSILTADIANELSYQLIEKSPTNLTPEQQAQIEIANSQVVNLVEQLDLLQVQLEQVNGQIRDAEDDGERVRLEEQLSILINQINQATANIAQFTDTIARLQQRTGSLEIIERATIPDGPVGNGPLSAMFLGAIVGAALAFGVALLIEYMNDTIRSADEATHIMQLPTLGVISHFGNSNDSYPDRLISSKNLVFKQTVEEYRTLRTNLLFSKSENKPSMYVITSPAPQNGKSVTAANLAVSMAMSNIRVLLIDADLRRPKTHEFFQLNNEVGLTTLLSIPFDENDPDDTQDMIWRQCLQESDIPNLRVISSGFIPENPTELLGSLAVTRWLKVFQRELDVDVIIFDTAPCLAVSDSVVLANVTNAQVVMVIQANSTRRGAAIRAKERFASVDKKVKGIVLNGANPRGNDYYGDYGDYYSSSKGDDAED